ncbi:polymeric immunoglobulin receptor-like isoform X2 [Clupea harengus]|uniref:polymeric immunoglobulin receptor-like isoform X2 n=1 Tax=Clupea harengus TaxID=7950 RepID=UPI0012AB6A29|nr:polymeric immunoglobulin receptor-like isoform X2 [Clupea harengus]
MGATLLKAFVGGAILFECSYKAEDKHKKKYFCKADDKSCLSNAIPPPTDNRFSLFDTSNGYFRILITALTNEDSGTYMCLVEKAPNVYANTTKTLEVNTDPVYMPSVVKTASVGEDVVIDCKYPAAGNNSIKYFYKQQVMPACPHLISSQSPQPNSRYSLIDDNKAHVFSVTIGNLTPDDAGLYWCGLRTGGFLGGIAMTTEVKLRIVERGTEELAVMTTAMAVCIPLFLVVAVILSGVVIHRCRVKIRQSHVSVIQTPPQVRAASPSAMSLDPPRPQLKCVYQNLQPDPTHPPAADYVTPIPSDPPGGDYVTPIPDGHPSENIYQQLDVSSRQADDVYHTLDPKPCK